MIGQLWGVYPTAATPALQALHAPEVPSRRVRKPERDCWLCARGACVQRIEDSYPAVVIHAIGPQA